MNRPLDPSHDLRARIHEVLAQKGLTLSKVSQASRRIFAGEGRYNISHDLYSDLSRSLTPSIHQLIALSVVSGYRLIDWLTLFGFPVADIPRLQLSLPFHRTTLLTASLYDPTAPIAWFAEKGTAQPLMRILPLGQLLAVSDSRPIATLQKLNRKSFLYAKVGLFDTLAFPELLPGSVVRANPDIRDIPREPLHRLCLVQHAGGLNCARVQRLASDQVTFLPTGSTHLGVDGQPGAELRVLGVVDMEFRNISRAIGPLTFLPHSIHQSLSAEHSVRILGDLLRNGRTSVGLSFREASALSRKLSQQLMDERYFAAAGSLSDYEAADLPPRHVQKILTLCVLYSIDFWQFLKAARLPIQKLGSEPMSPFVHADTTDSKSNSPSSELGNRVALGTFLLALLDQIEEFPFFLARSLPELAGLHAVSLRDVFWTAGATRDFLPLLEGVQFAVVNRRVKTPSPLRACPLWKQPLYLLVRRDGSYFCARFSIRNGRFLLHQYAEHSDETNDARWSGDAEIVGQVVSVVRKLSVSR